MLKVCSWIIELPSLHQLWALIIVQIVKEDEDDDDGNFLLFKQLSSLFKLNLKLS